MNYKNMKRVVLDTNQVKRKEELTNKYYTEEDKDKYIAWIVANNNAKNRMMFGK